MIYNPQLLPCKERPLLLRMVMDNQCLCLDLTLGPLNLFLPSLDVCRASSFPLSRPLCKHWNTVISQYHHGGSVPGTPPSAAVTKTPGCSRSFHIWVSCKTAEYLHETYAHPPVYFKSSLGYLPYLIQYRGCLNSY